MNVTNETLAVKSSRRENSALASAGAVRACCAYGHVPLSSSSRLTHRRRRRRPASTTSILRSYDNLAMSQAANPRKKLKLSDAGLAFVRLLEAVSASADAFPPLKSAASGALHFAKLVEVCLHHILLHFLANGV